MKALAASPDACHHEARVVAAVGQVRRQHRPIDERTLGAEDEDRLAVAVLVLDEVDRLAERGEAAVAAGNDDAVPQHRRRRLHRHLDVDRVARRGPDAAQARADEARHRAGGGERGVDGAQRRAVDAVGDEQRDVARLDAAVAGARHQRQRRRRRHLGRRRLVEHARLRRRHGDADAVGDALRQLGRDVGEHRDDALADRLDADLGELEAERADDVVLLGLGLALEEQTRLGEVVGELLGLAAHLVFHHRLRERDEAAHAGLERAAAAERVRLVGDAAARDRLAMQAVALVVVHLRDRRVDRDLVEVRSAEAGQLGVEVGVMAALQQRVVAGVDARDHVHRAERDLLGLGEEVVRVAVEHHAADLPHRHQLLGNDLGRVEDVEAEAIGLFLGEDLQAELVLRIRARLDRFPEVATMEVGVGAVDLDGLVPDHRVRAGDRLPVELAEARLALRR